MTKEVFAAFIDEWKAFHIEVNVAIGGGWQQGLSSGPDRANRR